MMDRFTVARDDHPRDVTLTTSTDALESARLTLDRERRQFTDELGALESFADRVRSLSVSQPPSADPAPLVGHTRGLERVRDAYVETVMSVPHFQAVYDEPADESLREELGEELAAAITGGSALHPQLKRSLLGAIRQSIRSREVVLTHLEEEADALARAERTLTGLLEEVASVLAQPLDQLEFNALRLSRERLEELRRRCDELAVGRQDQLRRRRISLLDIDEYGRYLYRDCESPFPVLSTIAAVGDLLEDAIRRVDARLARAR